MKPRQRKLVIVGDAGTGKTALLRRFASNEPPSAPHHPHVLESQVVKVAVDGDTVDLSLWDTVCDDEYERLRPLSYPNANIFIITFAVDDPISLKNVSEKWISEIAHFSPGVPILLVGCKLDLRASPGHLANLESTGVSPMTVAQALEVTAKIGALDYMECSAITGHGTDAILRRVTAISTTPRRFRDQRRPCTIQ